MNGRLRTDNLLGDPAVVLSLLIVAIVFATDVCTPLGVANGVLYSLAILVGLRSGRPRFMFALASLCAFLTILDIFVGPGPDGTEMWKVVVNRFLAIFMISLTTILGVKRRQAEEQRRQAEERTRLHLADLAHMGRLQLAGQLATSLAHELNQPLAAVSLQSEIATHVARTDPARSKEVLAALAEITEQAQRAGAILRALRALVQKGKSQRQALDVDDLVREVARLIDSQARRARVTLSLRQTNPLLPVFGDRIQIEQVLLNLLHNSLEAILASTSSGPRTVEVETTLVEGAVQVTVRDTGVGLPSDDPEQVFERFYSTKPDGMGVGLAISRSIVEAHGGRLWATANPDVGATFTFTLPTARRA